MVKRRRLKWPESVMLRFVELYQMHECLWNPRLEEYKNKAARNAALVSITKTMNVANLTVADIKKKVNTIRTMYKRERSLVCKSQRNEDPTEEPYVPTLIWYDTLDAFLRNIVYTSTCSDTTRNDNEQLKNESIFLEEYEFADSTSTSITTGDDTQDDLMLEEHIEIVPPSNSTMYQRNGVGVSHNIENISKRSTAVDNVQRTVHSNGNAVENEFDIFAKYVAIQLKQLPLYDALICQEGIQTLISKKRLEVLSRESMGQCYTPSSPAGSDGMQGE